MDYKNFIENTKKILNSENKMSILDKYKKIFGEEISYDTAQKRLKGVQLFLNSINFNDDKNSNFTSNNIETSIKSNGTQTHGTLIKMSEEQSKDVSFLLKAHGYSTDDFTLIEAKNSIWGSSDNTLYSSRISVKPKDKTNINFNELSDKLFEFFNSQSKITYEPSNYEYGSECFIPCLFDIHFAKYCSKLETGKQFNSVLAKQNIITVIKKYIDKLKDRKFEKIIFPIGNDFFNSESDGCTTNHTKQDNDLTYSEMFLLGTETLIECINLLSQIAPVDVILIQGNHSSFTEFYSACVLQAYYKDNKYITVDNEPIPRKYIKFGNTLLGFTHGNDEKDRIYGLMQSEVPKLWGETITHEFIVGHEHHEEVNEKNGVVVRKISTITAPDLWHVKNGYDAKRKAMAFIYDKSEGLSETLYLNIGD